jgi:CPA1 family monovalent cation:H+ antiporter
MGHRNEGLPHETTDMLYTVWDFVAFLAISVAFVFVGVYLKLELLWTYLWIVLPAIGIILLARFLMVYMISTVMYTWKKVIPGTWRDLIVWSGLRGPVSIVLVLGLTGLHIEHASEITAITFGVILFSILVQGLSLSKVTKKLGVANQTW